MFAELYPNTGGNGNVVTKAGRQAQILYAEIDLSQSGDIHKKIHTSDCADQSFINDIEVMFFVLKNITSFFRFSLGFLQFFYLQHYLYLK